MNLNTRNTGLIFMLLCIFTIASFAQTSNGFNYQAVARDSEGSLMSETKITVVLTIQDKSSKTVWEESHDLTTSKQGLFSIAVGTTPSAITEQAVDKLSDLDWSIGSYTLKVSVDGTDLGANPIMAVPMAFYGRDEDADPENEIQDLTLTKGNLSISKNTDATPIALGTYVDSKLAWQKNANNALLTGGAVGVGTSSPESLLDVVGSTPGDDPIFQVKNTDGVPVFAVYNEGVRILFPDDVSLSKGLKGGFAVGGYNTAKATESGSFLQVMPQGANINFFTDANAKSDSKGLKGGFAVGGYNTAKADESSFIYMDPYAVPITYDGGTIIFFPLFDALNPKGNCYIGTMSGQKHAGHFNTSIGYQAGYTLDAEAYTFPLLGSTNAAYNTFLGSFAGYATNLGDKNVYIGYQAGYNNTGTGNVFLGYQAGSNETIGENKLIIDNTDTSSPLVWGDFGNDILEVNGQFRVDNGTFQMMDNPGGTASEPIYYAYQGVAGSSSKTVAFTIHDYLWVTRGAQFDGTINATSFNTTSDARFKTNILPIKDAVELIKNLNGVYYNWKTDEYNYQQFNNERQIGLLAQEVEVYLPEIVDTNDEGYKSVDYSKLTSVLIEAVKEQQAIIENQQKQIDALKNSESTASAEMLNLMQEMQQTISTLNDKVESMERYTEK